MGELDRQRLGWRLAGWLGVAIVVVLAIVMVPGLGTLRTRLAHTQGGWVVVAVALEAGSVACFVLAFHCTFAPRVTRRSAGALATTAQGINAVVPAGGTGGLAAVGVVMVQIGLPRPFVVCRMVALFVLTSVLTSVVLVIVAGLGVAAGVLPGDAPLAASVLPAAVAIVLVVAVAYLLRHWPAKLGPRTSRWRAAAAETAGQVRDGLTWSLDLLRGRDPVLVVAAAGFLLFDLAALAAAFAAVGSSGLPIGTLALSYTLGQVGSVVSLPGTTEAGLLGALVLYGAPIGVAASAILIYRAVSTLVPLALGLAGLAGVRRLLAEDVDLEAGDLVV